eukprot:TRINITY_DN1122_c0_g1_i3.p1 TRINITY_DN1122_c0_g1~~TRINITY_DN1122_c0_g1_i3.p1  ORF type:complete len:286 (-),score=62.17 TRINITY_DN1122_c0_g1_i3:87-899(-)
MEEINRKNKNRLKDLTYPCLPLELINFKTEKKLNLSNEEMDKTETSNYSHKSKKNRLSLGKSKLNDQPKKMRNSKYEKDITTKVLLLGNDEPGKAEISKQMRLLYLNGYSESERKDFRKFIIFNVYKNMKILIDLAEEMKKVTEESRKLINLFQLVYENEIETLEMDEISALLIHKLWKSDSISDVFNHHYHSPSQSFDRSTPHYLDNILNIGKEDYLPSPKDVVLCRTNGIGIEEINFKYNVMNFNIIYPQQENNLRKKHVSDVKGTFF